MKAMGSRYYKVWQSMDSHIKSAHLFALCLFIYIVVFGSFYENYHAIIGHLTNGTFGLTGFYDYDYDANFILHAVYAWLNNYFPTLSVYPVLLIAMQSAISIAVYSLINNDLTSRKLRANIIAGFLMIISVLLAINLMFVNATRVCVSLFLLASYLFYLRSKAFSPVILFLISALLRIEAMIFCAFFVLVMSVLYQGFKVRMLTPFLLGLVVLIVHNVLLINFGSEAKKAYYFKEFDLVNRELPLISDDIVEQEAYSIFETHRVMDAELFDYQRLQANMPEVAQFHLIGGSFSNLSFRKTIAKSLLNISPSWPVIIVVFLLVCLSFNRNYSTLSGRKVLLAALLILPMFTAFVTMIPIWFIEPLLAGIAVFLMYHLASRRSVVSKRLLYFNAFCFLVLLGQFIFRQDQQIKNQRFSQLFIESLADYQSANNRSLIVFERFPNPFFYNKIYRPYTGGPLLSLNLYFYNSANGYQGKWRDYCHCNPLSIREKMSYVVSSKSDFAASPFYMEVLKSYLQRKYQWNIEYSIKQALSDDVIIYRISSAD